MFNKYKTFPAVHCSLGFFIICNTIYNITFYDSDTLSTFRPFFIYNYTFFVIYEWINWFRCNLLQCYLNLKILTFSVLTHYIFIYLRKWKIVCILIANMYSQQNTEHLWCCMNHLSVLLVVIVVTWLTGHRYLSRVLQPHSALFLCFYQRDSDTPRSWRTYQYGHFCKSLHLLFPLVRSSQLGYATIYKN